MGYASSSRRQASVNKSQDLALGSDGPTVQTDGDGAAARTPALSLLRSLGSVVRKLSGGGGRRREGEGSEAAPSSGRLDFPVDESRTAQAAAGARFLIAVAGPDAYVSNDWYVSEDQVSTWLYEAVHLSGRARLQPVDGNRGHGDALLATAEARLPKPAWRLETMEPQKRQAMLDGIRVIEVLVDRIEGQSKLNQHKTDADHVAVANRLAQAGTTAAEDLARRMRALRPDLVYDFPDDSDMP